MNKDPKSDQQQDPPVPRLNEQALMAAARCADDIFDRPEPRHVEQARKFIAAYLLALDTPQKTTEPSSTAVSTRSWPEVP